LAQQYYAYTMIQTPTDDMIADALTKPKAPYNYASFEANRLGVYELPIQPVSRRCVKFHLPLSCIQRLHLELAFLFHFMYITTML